METIVDGVTYLVADGAGPASGLYHGDTRHLSTLSVTVGRADLQPVADTWKPPSRRRRRFADVPTAINSVEDTAEVMSAAVVLDRRQEVAQGRYVETLTLDSYARREWTPTVTVGFDADFADIFEVRGREVRTDRDVTAEPDASEVTYEYAYTDDAGDGVSLRTVVSFGEPPEVLDAGRATFEPTLDPRDRWRVAVTVTPGGDESTIRAGGGGADAPDVASGGTRGEHTSGARSDERASGGTREERIDPFVLDGPVETGDPDHDRTFAQSIRDVRALTTVTVHGPVPLAGAPWYVTAFGRDSLIAAHLLLPVAPALARGVLRYLAAHQGSARVDHRDEAPGKILHEVRRGELARTGDVPHGPYYGTVDATPLWVSLLHETWRWTGDAALVEDLWPNLEAALGWIERTTTTHGDDPFLYYGDPGSSGVSHKVWRDSASGVQFADGRPATPPLACVTVQGYVYDALAGASALAADVADDGALASELGERADRFAERFDEAFWNEDRGYYAAALTAAGTQVDSITSNVGHCLWSGVVPGDRSGRLADRLLAPDLFSGWGIRTTSAADSGYRPLSYHAGSVWPHDNALAAVGLARYGHHEAARTVAASQLDAFSHFDGHSVPELFCGFDDSTPPATYPASCHPQVWAAAAPFGLLRASFDLTSDPVAGPTANHEARGVLGDAIEPVLDSWR